MNRHRIRRPVPRHRLGDVVRQQERVGVAQLVRNREHNLREQPTIRPLVLVRRREKHARITSRPARQVAGTRADHLARVAAVLAGPHDVVHLRRAGLTGLARAVRNVAVEDRHRASALSVRCLARSRFEETRSCALVAIRRHRVKAIPTNTSTSVYQNCGIIGSMPRTPDPEKTALEVLKQAEEEAQQAKRELDDKRQELKSAKANDKAAAERLTEAKQRVETRWVLLVGEAVLSAVKRELSDSGGEKQRWFDRLDPVLDTDIKPDDRVLYDDWKLKMQKLGATENDVTSDTVDADAMNSLKPIVGWKPVQVKVGDETKWGAKLSGDAVAELPQNLTCASIIVTTSKGQSWESRITEVVSRDEKTVIVLDTGKPKLPDDSPLAASDTATSNTANTGT